MKKQSPQGNSFIGRDRGQGKNRIFVIDRYVPNFDQDAGGRCCFMYLNLFMEIGLKVTFLGDDLRRIEPYTTILQQNGIEVLYGNIYNDSVNLENWFKDIIKINNIIYINTNK